jgi:hypothetical protein
LITSDPAIAIAAHLMLNMALPENSYRASFDTPPTEGGYCP